MPDAAPGAQLDPAFLDRLRRVIGDRNVDCPHCGYSLSGVPGPRCPECGRNVAQFLRIADTHPRRIVAERRERAARRAIGVLKAAALGAVTAGCVVVVWAALRP